MGACSTILPTRIKPFRHNFQQGFSLLEAIVALVLISMMGISLYSWLNSNVISLYKIQRVSERTEAMRNALNVMKDINPALQPSGNFDLQNLHIHWDSSVLEELKNGTGHLGSVSFYQVGFFKTDVHVFIENNLIAEFSLLQIGYKKVINNNNLVP